MKKVSVIVLAASSVGVRRLRRGGHAEKTHAQRQSHRPLRRARSSATASYTGDQAENEQDLDRHLDNAGDPYREPDDRAREDTDIGYQAMFGYRFHRYFAAELGLAQFGELESTAKRATWTSTTATASFRRASSSRSRRVAPSSRPSASCPSTTSSNCSAAWATCSPAPSASSARESTAIRPVRQRQGRLAESGVRHRLRLAHQPGLLDPRRIPAAGLSSARKIAPAQKTSR